MHLVHAKQGMGFGFIINREGGEKMYLVQFEFMRHVN